MVGSIAPFRTPDNGLNVSEFRRDRALIICDYLESLLESMPHFRLLSLLSRGLERRRQGTHASLIIVLSSNREMIGT